MKHLMWTERAAASVLVLWQAVFEAVVIAFVRDEDVALQLQTCIAIDRTEGNRCPVPENGLPEEPGAALRTETATHLLRRAVPAQVLFTRKVDGGFGHVGGRKEVAGLFPARRTVAGRGFGGHLCEPELDRAAIAGTVQIRHGAGSWSWSWSSPAAMAVSALAARGVIEGSSPTAHGEATEVLMHDSEPASLVSQDASSSASNPELAATLGAFPVVGVAC